MIEFEHEVALQDHGISYNDLPADIKGSINAFKKLKANVYADPQNVDPQKERDLQATSASIADDIQNWWEDQEEEKEKNQNQQNMSKEAEALKARAIAAGLPETASETEVAAKEAEIAGEANKKKALAERAKAVGLAENATEAEIVAAETEAAKKGEKKEEKKEEKKPVKEEDIFDELDI